MNKEADKYFSILYPEYEKLSLEERFNFLIDRLIISENIDKIDKCIQECKKEGTIAQKKGLNEQEIIKYALKKVKADIYFNMLYPKSEEQSPEEQFNLMRDQNLIYEHIDEIDDSYKNNMKEGSMAKIKGWSEQEIIQFALKKVKANNYFNMLYPKYEEQSPEEQFNLMRDQNLIYEHIDEIDDKYKKHMQGEGGEKQKKNAEQEIMNKIILEIKERTKLLEQIRSLIGDTSKIPIQEAAQVEKGEKTNKEREGEEFGDGN